MAFKNIFFSILAIPLKATSRIVNRVSTASELDSPLNRGIKKEVNGYGVVAVIFFTLTIMGGFFWHQERQVQVWKLEKAGQVLMLTQRIPSVAQQALAGQPAAFQSLAQSRVDLLNLLKDLAPEHDGVQTLRFSSQVETDALAEFQKALAVPLQDEQLLQAGQEGLVGLHHLTSSFAIFLTDLSEINKNSDDWPLGEPPEQAKLLTGVINRLNRDIFSLILISNGSLIASRHPEMGGAEPSPEIVVLLNQVNQDILSFDSAFGVLPSGNQNVLRIRQAVETDRKNIQALIGQAPHWIVSQKSGEALVDQRDFLLSQAKNLVAAYYPPFLDLVSIATLILGGAFLLTLLGLFRTYTRYAQLRAAEEANINSRNQSAILRLMNELSELADGDLTVRATVTEEITGAIADSLNYTTESFRKLVERIISTVQQMGGATQKAGGISRELLTATQEQAQEIKEASEAVKLMAQSIKDVDSNAARSAEVARRTLEVTGQGAQAVRNTISGMDGIREQIQDTSKRIKRLGESSQEIGEIVDLISDITEQTNVLALNASIQASAAGEAGRGFSVVAEEVQRLAERSAGATQQIGALVKTIQGDTHDAVAAMEKSTLGFVEGAKLSDEAGQSLREIETVSNELAVLINGISASTKMQTEMANAVAEVMYHILQITVQTTEGTRNTADSVEQITHLTKDLKESISGFKL